MMKYTEEKIGKKEKKKKEKERRWRQMQEMKNVLLGRIHRKKSRCIFGIFIFENNLVGQG